MGERRLLGKKNLSIAKALAGLAGLNVMAQVPLLIAQSLVETYFELCNRKLVRGSLGKLGMVWHNDSGLTFGMFGHTLL